MEMIIAFIAGIVLGAALVWLGTRLNKKPASDDSAVNNAAQLAWQQSQQQIQALVQPLHDALAQHQQYLHSSSLQQQQHQTALQTNLNMLNEETKRLRAVLHNPQQRGSWGELVLLRALEIAGLQRDVHYAVQPRLNNEDESGRPDVIITLPNGLQIAIDAKVPINAVLANDTADNADPNLWQQHAKQLREHVKTLSKRKYWQLMGASSPPMVVLFIPNEGLLSAALVSDTGLLEFAAQQQVLLASPANLLGILAAVHAGWQNEQSKQNADKIAQLAQQMLEYMKSHLESLQKHGQRLSQLQQSYNSVIHSLDRRLLPKTRQLATLAPTTISEAALTAPPQLALHDDVDEAA